MSLVSKVRAALTEDLRHKRYRGKTPASKGHCYVASEALYHLLGGKDSGWKPMQIRHEGSSHWFLLNKSGQVLDATSDQFNSIVPVSLARGRGFLTSKPSRRAQVVIDRVLGDQSD